jgi:hypothetical protein
MGEIRRSSSDYPALEQRSRNDAGCIVEVAADDHLELGGVLANTLRATDRWRLENGHARMHLHGCDESDATSVVSRLADVRVLSTRTALQEDLILDDPVGAGIRR